jgi:hypothetical protein
VRHPLQPGRILHPMSSFLPLFLYSLVNQVERAGKGRGMKEELRSLRSLQDGNENRGQLFALLSQRCELFHADNPRFHEQFQPVGALTRCFPSSSPATSRVLPSMSRLPNTLHSSISRGESPHFAMN